MQTIVKDIREIANSKELYGTKPHPFISMFIYILLASILLIGVWMYFGEIDIVVKGIGVVRPNENISHVRNRVEGEVVICNLDEGKYVEKEDVLFTVDYEELGINRTQVIGRLEHTRKKIDFLKKMKESVEQDANLFSSEKESEYYERFVKYQQDYLALKYTHLIENKSEIITTTQIEINQKLYQDKIHQYEQNIKKLEEYRLAIVQEENLFEDKQCLEAVEFNAYLLKVYELTNSINEKKMIYNTHILLQEEGLIANKEVEDARLDLQYTENELSKLKLKAIGTIENELKELNIARQIAQQEQDKLIIDDTLLEANTTQRSLTLKKYKTDMLVSLYNQMDEQQILYESLQRELESIELDIAKCKIVAPISGTLHIIQEVNKGDLIGAGMDIATIIPTNDDMYKIEIFIPNHDIVAIKAGDQIKYKFDALPYKEYGQLEGAITNISVDTALSDTQGVSGYLIEGSMENEVVYSYKDEPAEIKIGMTCEAHIVTQQKKIIYYLLEKINLKN